MTARSAARLARGDASPAAPVRRRQRSPPRRARRRATLPGPSPAGRRRRRRPRSTRLAVLLSIRVSSSPVGVIAWIAAAATWPTVAMLVWVPTTARVDVDLHRHRRAGRQRADRPPPRRGVERAGPGVAATSVSPSGSWSSTTTFVAVDGPRLVATTVKVADVPRRPCGRSTDLVIARSIDPADRARHRADAVVRRWDRASTRTTEAVLVNGPRKSAATVPADGDRHRRRRGRRCRARSCTVPASIAHVPADVVAAAPSDGCRQGVGDDDVVGGRRSGVGHGDRPRHRATGDGATRGQRLGDRRRRPSG